jgi:hypothetical protein
LNPFSNGSASFGEAAKVVQPDALLFKTTKEIGDADYCGQLLIQWGVWILRGIGIPLIGTAGASVGSAEALLRVRQRRMFPELLCSVRFTSCRISKLVPFLRWHWPLKS